MGIGLLLLRAFRHASKGPQHQLTFSLAKPKAATPASESNRGPNERSQTKDGTYPKRAFPKGSQVVLRGLLSLIIMLIPILERSLGPFGSLPLLSRICQKS